jgi:hypothetical protein
MKSRQADPALLVDYAVRSGGIRSIVRLGKHLNFHQSIRETAKALGIHESTVSRLARGLFVVKYVLNPALVETFEALKALEEEEYANLRDPGVILEIEGTDDRGTPGTSKVSHPALSDRTRVADPKDSGGDWSPSL